MDLDQTHLLRAKQAKKMPELPLSPYKRNCHFPIVCIGSSVGGLDALKKFFTNISPYSDIAFVVAAHHDFSHENDLVKLISSYTQMDTILIKDGTCIGQNNVYVNPPNVNIEVKDGKFFLTKPKKFSYDNLPINFLLRSLAYDQGANVIAIILSGLAGFGISSLVDIKKRGGIVLAQDPTSTKYNGMPSSAIDTGYVDYIVPPEKMPDLLNKHINQKRTNMVSLSLNKKINLLLSNNEKKPVLDGELYKLINELNSNQISLELKNEQLRIAQIELEESCNKYIDLYDLAPAGYFTLSNLGLITNVNNAGSTLLNIKKDMLINTNFLSYVTDDYKNTFVQYCQQVNTSLSPQICELKLFKQDKSCLHTRILSKKIFNKKDSNNEILLFIRDITLEKQYEERIHNLQSKIYHADRLGLVEQLASMIVHEINQPLGVIANYANGCIRRLKENNYETNDLLYAMNQIIHVTGRADEIYKRLKSFKCKNSLSYQLVHIDDLINEVITLIQYEITEYKVKLNYRPALHLPNIMLDKIHVEQVILNIARNAIEAMRDDNTREPEFIIETEEMDKKMIVINIIDNGPGFSSNISNRLFEPNFTTKSYGVGLGLAISRTVIEAHGGTLTAISPAKGGACFKIILPIRESI